MKKVPVVILWRCLSLSASASVRATWGANWAILKQVMAEPALLIRVSELPSLETACKSAEKTKKMTAGGVSPVKKSVKLGCNCGCEWECDRDCDCDCGCDCDCDCDSGVNSV